MTCCRTQTGIRAELGGNEISIDGTREWLEASRAQCPFPVRYVKANIFRRYGIISLLRRRRPSAGEGRQ